MSDTPNPPLDPARCWAETARAAERMAAAVGTDTIGAPVPDCPDWDLHRLVEHTGRVHRWVVARLVDPPSAPPRSWDLELDVPDGIAVAPWLTEGVERLSAVLRSQDPAAEVDSWAGRVPASFWTRRMLHETVVHAWDAERAAGVVDVGSPSPVDLDLAVDAADEVLDVVWRHRLDLSSVGPSADGATLHVHATDSDLAEGAGEWLVTVRSDGIETRHEHAKGDVAVRGPAWSLLLALLGRVPAARRADAGLDVFGDDALLDRVLAATRF